MKDLNRPSLFVAIVLMCLVAIVSYQLIPNKIIAWDIYGYYIYLPATFIYNDVGLKDLTPLHESLKIYDSTPYLYQLVQMPNGTSMNIYQVGMAILYLPFFFIGHIIASTGNYPTDGFSAPYQLSVFYGGIIYSMVGIYFLWKMLRLIFKEDVVILVLTSIIVGTNYFLHTTMYGQNLMTHSPLFMLYAILIYLTIKWHKSQKFKYIILLGFIAGLMILVRPSEILVLLIPAFWGINSLETFKNKMILLWEKWLQIAVFSLIIIALGLIQVSYNHLCTGEFISSGYSYAYEDSMELRSPNILDVLFSFRKGWLIYSPIIIFSILGIFLSRKYQKDVFAPALIFLAFNIYLISSWSNWWYAGSYGHRAFIQSLPIMAIPMGVFYTRVISSRQITRLLIFSLMTFFILLNLFQSWQFKAGIIDPERMTAKYYFSIFGKRHISDSQKDMLLFDRSSVDLEKPIDNSRFHLTLDTILNESNSGNFVSHENLIVVNNDVEYPKGFDIQIDKITDDFCIVEYSAKIFLSDSVLPNQVLMAIYLEHGVKAQAYKTLDINTLNLESNNWNQITIKYKMPFIKGNEDKLKAYLWNIGKISFKIKDQRLMVYSPY